MEINYELTLRDKEEGEARLKKGRSPTVTRVWRILLFVVIFGLIFSNTIPRLDQIEGVHYVFWIWQLIFAAVIGSMLVLPRWSRSASGKRWREQFTGHMSLTLAPAGVSATAPGGRMAFRAWPEFLAFSGDDTYFYIYLRSDVAVIVPRAELGDRAEAFAERFHALWEAHPENAGKKLPQDPPVPYAGRFKGFLANIKGGARIAFLMDFVPNSFNATGYQVYRLFFVLLLCHGVADYVYAFPASTFNIYGVSHFASLTLLTIMAAAVISGLLLQRSTMLRLLTMIVSSSLIISLILTTLYFIFRHLFVHATLPYRILHIVDVLWTLLAVYRISGKLYLQPWPGALSHAGVFAFFVFGIGTLLPNQMLFYNSKPEKGSYYQLADKINLEDTYYRQPGLIQQGLASFTPREPGMENIYYVGFAGDGREQVFTNDVSYAKRLLDRRFGTDGHSLIMDNNPEDVDDTPLANRHNLDAVLKGIAARMDKQHDVLFLFLSSHGGQDHRLSVSHWPLGLHDLKAEDLKAMLDKYGIKNRIIAVSACYSGGFLDVLKNDNSLIMTASSRSHYSYGCGDHTKYTFFGKAYFVQALAHENNFIDAFKDARKQIAERESKEGDSHSEPQIYVGRNIQAVLQRLPIGG